MINVKEIIDDLVETGMSREDAVAKAREMFNSKDKHCNKETCKFAAKHAKASNPARDRKRYVNP